MNKMGQAAIVLGCINFIAGIGFMNSGATDMADFQLVLCIVAMLLGSALLLRANHKHELTTSVCKPCRNL